MKGNKFGGERLESASNLARNNLIEHLARYDLVEGVDGGMVLDMGCGSGHGSYRMKERFAKVYGVDVSSDAIAYARKHWNAQNISYIEADALRLPFEDGTFDVVTMFEVFEHVCDWESLLQEARRVMKPGGVIYISTPNKELYSPGTKKPINPHHCFEMTIQQFRSAVIKYFQLQKLLGQRTPVYNDHWVWGYVNPILFLLKGLVPYSVNNSIKLKIINAIKPELDLSDVVFSDKETELNKSRFMVAICKK